MRAGSFSQRAERQPRIAVIGAGAAGLSAAYGLAAWADVTVYEREAQPGGHALTVTVPDGPDAGLPLDVAFMVMNTETYPRFTRLLEEIGGLSLGPSEMSFSYCCRATGDEYAVNFDVSGDGAGQARPMSRSPLLRSIFHEILRFCRMASEDVKRGGLEGLTLDEYLRSRGLSDRLRRYYVVPLGSALWSSSTREILRQPAVSCLTFFENHGLLSLGAGLSWRHVRGGCCRYVGALLAARPGVRLRTRTPVVVVHRRADGVTVTDATGVSSAFDAAVLAAHADQALALLADADEEERALLGSVRYQRNAAVLHWDAGVMARDRLAWASWNYERETDDDEAPVCLSYYLNRLQEHHQTARPYFLTLNRRAPVDEAKVLARFTFDHPVFDGPAVRAQGALDNRPIHRRIQFAGSYLGYGFHEDAVRAGLLAAERLQTALQRRE